MYAIMLADCIVLVFMAALVYWPPFILAHMSKDDEQWYAGIVKRVFMMPRYELLQFATFLVGSLFIRISPVFPLYHEAPCTSIHVFHP